MSSHRTLIVPKTRSKPSSPSSRPPIAIQPFVYPPDPRSSKRRVETPIREPLRQVLAEQLRARSSVQNPSDPALRVSGAVHWLRALEES